MLPSTLSYSEDLPLVAAGAVAALFGLTVVMLTVELRLRLRNRLLVWLSGLLATLALSFAVLRPSWVTQSGLKAAPRVVILVDGSHRLELPADQPGSTRRVLALQARKALQQAWGSARMDAYTVGSGELLKVGSASQVIVFSDLSRALSELLSTPGEKPRAIVVISDGRFSAPAEVGLSELSRELSSLAQGIPIHTVRLAEHAPADRSIRSVGTSGTALAHQPFRLDIVVGCAPEPACSQAEVVVSEIIEGREPTELSRGVARRKNGDLALQLEVTLERAGSRVIEVALAESRDTLPHNDRRLLPIEVRRDRTRILHVAGRPTYDVRALRQFLKADESIDLVSFFILRTEEDDVNASQDDLALIPFPVDELLTEHLPSFDAIILQDIDAHRYKLDHYFSSIRRYVLSGGGLILVGGPSGFSAGGYANSPIQAVLPVDLPQEADAVKVAPFVPRYTKAGRAAPILRELRELLSESLPEMSGFNRLGRAKPAALVLWEHPEESAADAPVSEAMPLLALGEVGDGRSIALAVDGTHHLRFGRLGVRAAGEGHGALWEGLLGWLMRDPRFEAARPRLDGPCIIGYPTRVSVNLLPGTEEQVRLSVSPLGPAAEEGEGARLEPVTRSAQNLVFQLPPLPAGAYAARVAVGSAPPTRMVFACEVGGDAHADSRPDPGRLRAISQATEGVSVKVGAMAELPQPNATFISTRRSTRPIAPPWVWSSVAAFLLGAHWLVRRWSGFS